jgi:hypothetical protein
MLKTRLTAFFNSVELPSVDGPSIVAEIINNPVYWVTNADKLEHYKGFSLTEQISLSCSSIVTHDLERDMYIVSSVVDVKRCMLAPMLADQLGYVPEFAILEFYMGVEHNTIMCRETIVCASVEANGTRKLAAISKGSVPEEVEQAFIKSPDSDRVWLHVSLETARILKCVAENPMPVFNQRSFTVVAPVGSNYVH